MQKFVDWLNGQRGPFHLDDVSLKDIHAFLAWRGQQGWSRVSVATSASALRAFFRYAAERGWCPSTIAGSIDGPVCFSMRGFRLGRHGGMSSGSLPELAAIKLGRSVTAPF